MERKELRSKTVSFAEQLVGTSGLVYLEQEADAVMDAMEAKIAKLDDAFESCKANLESEKATNEELRERIKELQVGNARKLDANVELVRQHNRDISRIKELEDKIARSNDNVDAMLDIADKAHTECGNLEYEKGVNDRHIKYLNNRIKELEEQLRETK